MITPPQPPEATLDDFTRMTKQYAAFGSTAFGLAYVRWGALLMLAGAATITLPEWGPNLVFVSVPAWFLLVERARRHYQGRGGVVVEEIGMSPRRARQNGLAVLFLACIALVVSLARHGSEWAASQGTPARVGMVVVLACTVAAAALAVAWGRGYRDTYIPFVLLWAWLLLVPSRTSFLPATREQASGPAFLLATASILLAIQGVREHRSWSELDRRWMQGGARAP